MHIVTTIKQPKQQNGQIKNKGDCAANVRKMDQKGIFIGPTIAEQKRLLDMCDKNTFFDLWMVNDGHSEKWVVYHLA